MYSYTNQFSVKFVIELLPSRKLEINPKHQGDYHLSYSPMPNYFPEENYGFGNVKFFVQKFKLLSAYFIYQKVNS